jgi:predicted transcriptional regulator
MTVDAVEYVRGTGDIAKIPSSSSKTALYQRMDELNEARIHRYPDVTDLPEHLETMLKDNADGRPSVHEFTDVSGKERTVVRQKVDPPDAMILFIASDNQKIDLNDLPELRNRALIISTDSSAELTERVMQRQADMEVGLYEWKFTEEEAEQIRDYIRGIPNNLYTGEDPKGEIWNLPLKGFANENPLPSLFPESRMDFKRFNDFIKSVTLFHYDRRMEITLDERDAIASMLSTPEDVWLAWRIFGEKMVLSALNLRDEDFEILEILREKNEALSVNDLMTEMRKKGFNMSDKQVRGSVNGMLDKGYVFKDQDGARVTYSPSPWATPQKVSKTVTVDFSNIVDKTIEVAEMMLPPGHAEEYIEMYCTGNGLITTDPLNGETVNIVEQAFTDEIEEQEMVEEAIFDESTLYGAPDGDSDSDTSSAATDSDGNSTLSGVIG